MKITLLDAPALSRTLPRLIANHEEIYLAVAWAHTGAVATRLIENRHKFKSVTVGLDFCATHPDFVDLMRGVRNAFVFKQAGSCFHPKIYLFKSGDKAEAIVGSANFTNGGLGSNSEACLHVRCNADEPFIGEILAKLKSYAAYRQPVTQELADIYRRQAKLASRLPRPSAPILPSDTQDFERLRSDLLTMDWREFIRAVRLDPEHHFPTRLEILRYVQGLFVRRGSFADLSLPEWKVVAGIVHKDAVGTSGLTKSQIGWFGSMQGAGSFTNLIVNQDDRIAEAIDTIPVRGPVTQADYDRFCDLFTAAFEESARIGGVPTATRLLAMKRPDVFACVNKGNKPRLAEALSFAPSTLSLNNYWERVIEPLRLANWYTSDRPAGRDAEAWDSRVALVDAIFYEEV